MSRQEGRIEVGEDVVLVASVTDAETPVDALQFDWSANVGIVTGTGATAVWRLPRGTTTTPARVEIRLTVLESFTAVQDGVATKRENRSSASAPIFVAHDSEAEVGDLAVSFLRLFADNAVEPILCVAAFSATCPGKQLELDDIEAVRRSRRIGASTIDLRQVSVDPNGQSATAKVECRFESVVLEKVDEHDPFQRGDSVVAEGDCELTAIYEDSEWALCTSRFFGSEELGALEARRSARGRSVAAALLGR